MLMPDQIKTRRKALGLSLDRLAALSGVSWSTLQRLEAGDRKTYKTNIRMVELTLDEAERGRNCPSKAKPIEEPHIVPPVPDPPPPDTNDYADIAWRWMSAGGVNSTYSQFADFAQNSLETLADECVKAWDDETIDRERLIKALGEYRDRLAG